MLRYKRLCRPSVPRRCRPRRSVMSLLRLCKRYRFRLFKQCPNCGTIYDYFVQVNCPYCNDASTLGPFILFPELQLPTSPSSLFPELWFLP